MTSQMKNFRVRPYLTAITLSTSLLCIPAMAETIYKSVDAEGNVTFSSTPPAGVESQQIELQPGPTPAQQQQSTEAEQNLETQSNEMYQETVEENSAEAPEQSEEQQVSEEQPVGEDQQDFGDAVDPVYVGDGYVGDPDRNERVRDGVDDVRDVAPRPAEAGRAAGRAR
jgi:hypothetical protein